MTICHYGSILHCLDYHLVKPHGRKSSSVEILTQHDRRTDSETLSTVLSKADTL